MSSSLGADFRQQGDARCATSSPMSPACGSAMPTTPSSAPASTAIVFDEPAVARVDVRGGGPGTRETDLLDPAKTVERIDAIALSGGSAFGLDAGVRRAGLAARAGPRLCDRRRARADRAGRDPVRSAQRRRQELGPLSALSRSRLRGRGRGAAHDFRARQRRRRASARPPSTSRAASARPRRMTRDGHHDRRARRRQCRRQRHRSASGPHFWAAPFERTRNSAAAACRRRCRRRAGVPHQGRRAREHHPRAGRDRRRRSPRRRPSGWR